MASKGDSKQLKILVSGDVGGNYSQLFSRITSIQNKNGPFDMLLCVGDFFGDNEASWEPYKSGQTKVPVATYILGPSKPEHMKYITDKDGGELCENVTYLGERGIFTGSSGLQIAYLSGMESDTSDNTHFNITDVESLHSPLTQDSKKFKGVDILMTSQWSHGVDKYGTELEGIESSKCGSQAISRLAQFLRPRYHFSGLEGVHYERQPYRNHKILAEGAKHVTRFISLAKVGNKIKKKYMYAFSIVPLCHMDNDELIKQPPDVTECPYKTELKAPIKQKDEGQQFFYDMKAGNRKRGPDGEKKQPRKPPQPTGPCWFCLASPEVEKHLVVSVGTHTYLALAKGPLISQHLLILPIGHYQSIVTAPPEVLSEIEKYKSSVKKMFKSQGKSPVFFERNYKSQHLQIQVVPVVNDAIMEVKDTFQECAESHKIELHEIPPLSDLKQIVPAGAPYFYTELPSGEKLLHRISKFFPLQFGREALTGPNVLNMPDRVDWKNCKNTKQEECEMVEKLRTKFQSYDFNDI